MPGKLKPSVSYLLGGRLATAAKGDVSASTAGGGPPPPPPTTTGAYPDRYITLSDAEYPFNDMQERSDVLSGQTGATWYTVEALQSYSPYSAPGFYITGPNAVVRWQTVGGDWWDGSTPPAHNGTVGCSEPPTGVAVTVSGPKWVSFTVTNMVKQWVSRTYRNAGFMIQGLPSGASTNFATRWATALDGSGNSTCPKLVVVTASQGTVTLQGRPAVAGDPASNICRSIDIVSTQTNSTAQALTMGCSGSKRSLVWFLLSQFTDANDIVSATLSLYSTAQSGVTNTVKVYRLMNPQDPENPAPYAIAPMQVGLAANYDRDQGIEADPDVIFVQKFVDANHEKVWWTSPTSGIRRLVTSADSGFNGWTPLVGLYNALEMTLAPSSVNPNGYGPVSYHWSAWRGTYKIKNTTYDGHLYDGNGRLKPLPVGDAAIREVTEELYGRYYLLFGDGSNGGYAWNVMPMSGKYPGWDGRYADVADSTGIVVDLIPGMGRGNSQSGADGFTGWSARGQYDHTTREDAPHGNLRGIGWSDAYIQTGYAGINMLYDRHYLGFMRKGEWNCVEFHTRMNTVVGLDGASADEKVRKVATIDIPPCPMYPTFGTRAAAMYVDADPSSPTGQSLYVTLDQPEATYGQPNSPYQTGKHWRFGGVAHYSAGSISSPADNPWVYTDRNSMYQDSFGDGAFPITVIDAQNFKVPIKGTCGTRPDQTAPDYDGTPAAIADLPPFKEHWLIAQGTSGVVVCAPTEGVADGLCEAWVNGRMVYQHTNYIFRHNRYCTDGVSPFGIDNAWFLIYHGGAGKPTNLSSCYWANVVIAKKYIGPMVIPPSAPAWLDGKATNTWIQVPGSKMSEMTDGMDALYALGLTGPGPTYSQTTIGGHTIGTARQKIYDYSGAAFKTDGSEMLAFGGGGAGAWGGNDIRGLRLEDDAPSWKNRTPASAAYNLWYDTYNLIKHHYMKDGTPNSRHAYSQLHFHDATNTAYLFGCQNVWEYDTNLDPQHVDSISFDTKVWQAGSDNVGSPGAHPDVPGFRSVDQGWAAKDAATELIYVARADSLYAFDASANLWATVISHAMAPALPSTGFDRAIGAIDSVHKRILRIGVQGASLNTPATIDINAKTYTVASFTGNASAIAAISDYRNYGMVYDAGIDKFLLFKDDGYLYAISYVSDAVWSIDYLGGSPSALGAGGPVANESSVHGAPCAIWTRMAYVPNLRGVCILQRYDRPAFFVRTA